MHICIGLYSVIALTEFNSCCDIAVTILSLFRGKQYENQFSS